MQANGFTQSAQPVNRITKPLEQSLLATFDCFGDEEIANCDIEQAIEDDAALEEYMTQVLGPLGVRLVQ